MTAQLTFSDEFDTLSLRSGSSGVWSTTFQYQDAGSNGATLAGNGEQQWYLNSEYGPTASVRPWAVSNGVMTLTAAPASGEISSLINGYKYTSGEINTAHSFTQTYGYFEMRAQLPAGQGLWPAFWLMPKDGSWPPELDVMEMLGNDPSKIYTTVHTNQSGGHTMATQGADVGDVAGGYHTYAVDWEPDTITFYFDGKAIYQTATPSDMHKPMFMIANLAVGGSWPGNPDGSTPFPASMTIDYVHAWNANPYTADGSAPGTAAPSPVTPGVTTPAASAASGQIDGTNGADVIIGGDDHPNRIVALDGDDRITGGLSANEINGNAGNDTITGRSQAGDNLFGGQGDDQIDASGSTAHNLLNGNKGADTLHASDAGDTLHGGQGDDLLIGGSGQDWLSGDRGHDTLTGGGGADVFSHFSGGGVSVVTDFNFAEGDRVQLAPGNGYDVTQQGQGADASVVIDVHGGGEIILQHTSADSLGTGWIFT
jgi:serralysin